MAATKDEDVITNLDKVVIKPLREFCHRSVDTSAVGWGSILRRGGFSLFAITLALGTPVSALAAPAVPEPDYSTIGALLLAFFGVGGNFAALDVFNRSVSAFAGETAVAPAGAWSATWLISAAILAGGSAGMMRIFEQLGIRSAPTEPVPPAIDQSKA
ncbi:MAG: hypothetical protein E5X67_06085 [Mesorhizobium sp.]|uniref:hypothetical protein n=1 Tax=Mesorhizobium sp. TaxID=1871066 RepID=UPI0011F959B7|nr:hypothetical protein [Mesorhizobium sp.]TIP29608.1 MAG: hypothetical protein E5X67_06085 [Mesorhizobium sp.]